MKKTVDGFKWLSVSITVASLVMVFWVWPAWNSASQTWYLGNNQDLINTMYRDAHPPSGHNAPFEFTGSFMGAFMANEAAIQMLNFGMVPWQYHIEWYRTEGTPMPMEQVMFTLTIGRYSGMGMMMKYVPFFSAMGSGFPPGSINSRTVVEGSTMLIPAVMDNLVFMQGDKPGAKLMLMTSPPFNLTVPLANSCYITYPLSDPAYPGGVTIPTLSQWGALVLAILLPFLYTCVIRRRIRIGRT